MSEGIRLQKYLADAGVASRRASEALITAGRVCVNGRIAKELGVRVDPEADRVQLDGTEVRVRRKRYVALHKPAGCLCARSDPEHRRTVMELLPREWRTLYPVGRLDRETEGLLFLTNDGEFCLRITHPRYGIVKRYRAMIEGRVEPGVLRRLQEGVLHGGERLTARRSRLLEANNTNSIVEVELQEGRNREVRRMFEALGLRVLHLRRLQIGPIRLGELPEGKWRVLTPAEVSALMPEGSATGGVSGVASAAGGGRRGRRSRAAALSQH